MRLLLGVTLAGAVLFVASEARSGDNPSSGEKNPHGRGPARTTAPDAAPDPEDPYASPDVPEEAPPEQAPSEQAPDAASPAKQAPSEQAPCEQAPCEQAPCEQAPCEQAPSTEGPEQAPSERADPKPGPMRTGASREAPSARDAGAKKKLAPKTEGPAAWKGADAPVLDAPAPKPGQTLFNTGFGVFATLYGASLVVGAVAIDSPSPRSSFLIPLVLPVVGPLISAAFDDAGEAGRAVLLIDAGVQSTGIVLALIGAVIQKPKPTSAARSAGIAFEVTPFAGPRGSGVGLSGSF